MNTPLLACRLDQMTKDDKFAFDAGGGHALRSLARYAAMSEPLMVATIREAKEWRSMAWMR